MAIPAFAVRDYLRAKRYDSKRAKLSKKKKVKKAYKKTSIDTTYKAHHHQMVCELIGRSRRGFAFFTDMGSGKTKITIDLFLYRKDRGEMKRLLVLVPNTQNMYEWEAQIKEHAPQLSVHIVDQAGRDARREGIFGDEDIVVATYAGWGWVISASNTKISLRNPIARKFEEQFQGVAWDEASKLTNHRSTFWRAANRFVKQGVYRWLLTATPTNKDPMAYWALLSLVDDGQTVGTLPFFREVFFTKKKLYFSKFACNYVFNMKLQKDLSRIIRESSITYFIDECTDLPPLTGGISSERLLTHLSMAPKDVWAKYQEAEVAMRAARGDRDEIKKSYAAMRGMASGWMRYRDVEDRKQVFKFKENPKADQLLEILQNCPNEHVIVFHHYNLTGEVISDALKSAGISHARLYGKQSAKKNRAAYDALKAKKIRVLVASSSGAYGLNPQDVCRRIVFFESFDSARDRLQAERRIFRPGQEKSCFIHDLCMIGTLDERVISATKGGKNLLDLLLKTPTK